jgi:hypothetical protein
MFGVNLETVIWTGWRHCARLMSVVAVLILALATVLPPLTATPFDPCDPTSKSASVAFLQMDEAPQNGTCPMPDCGDCDGSDPRALGGIPENEHETKLAIAGPAGLLALSGAHLSWDKDFVEHPVGALCAGHFAPPKRPPNVA